MVTAQSSQKEQLGDDGTDPTPLSLQEQDKFSAKNKIPRSNATIDHNR
jgi:hypothetical protein